MSILRIGMFGGRIPRLAPRLLPDTAAQVAMNTKLTSGELRSWWQPKKLATLTTTYPRSVYRYMHKGVRKFIASRRYTRYVESALINDSFDRLYFSNSDGFFITTKADIDAGTPAQHVGVPTPDVPNFAVTVEGGDQTLTETRVYVMTLVSKYGEESGPTPPKLFSGPADGAWTLTGLASARYDALRYPNVTHLRIYRTITSASGVDYRLAHELPIATAFPDPFVDRTEATVLAARSTLDTLNWSPPPEGLQGVIAMSGGFNAGFKGRTVYFSEPYYPHAWPEDYQLAVKDPIVALGFYGSTLVILTTGRVAVAIGTAPSAMTLVTDGKIMPCVSRESVVSTTGMVGFASEEGLISVSDAGVQNITQAFLTRDEWTRLTPENIKGAIYEDRYLGFYSDSMGFAFQFNDPSTAWTDVQHPGVSAVVEDATTSRTLLVTGQDVVEWDGDMYNPMSYMWRSKPTVLPKPENFGAMQVRGNFDVVAADRPDVYPVVEATIDDPMSPNTGLSGVNDGEAIGGPADANTEDPKYSGVHVRLYGGRKLRWEGMVRSEKPFRLPSGFKDDEIEVEVIGSIALYSIAIASTMKALETTP